MRGDWRADPGRWHGEWEEPQSGSGVAIVFIDTDEIGYGPALHSHPYAETFIVRKGTARFYLGDKELVVREGGIVVAKAHVPHRFENAGPGRLETIDIHASPRFITDWL